MVLFVSYFCWFWLLCCYLVNNLVIFFFMIFLFGVIFGVLLLGELFSLNFVVGVVLVFVGIILVSGE